MANDHTTTKSFNPADPKSYEELMDAAYAEREGILANGKRPHNYILSFYDAQNHKRYTNEPTWEESDGGNFHKDYIQQLLKNYRLSWEGIFLALTFLLTDALPILNLTVS